MTIGKVQSEARCLYSTSSSMTAHLAPTAAFLTQTVNLDDGTSVKFEIWCAYCNYTSHVDVLILYRDTAGQERYKVRSRSFVASTKGY